MSDQNETTENTEQGMIATIEQVQIEPLADDDLEKVVGGVKKIVDVEVQVKCSQHSCC